MPRSSCPDCGELVAAAPVSAQQYPKKQVIRIIVPQAVGSATDTVGRLLAQHIGAEIDQQIIVDNRPGAGGLLGSELAAKSPPDGYTLLLANISTHGVNPGALCQAAVRSGQGFRADRAAPVRRRTS